MELFNPIIVVTLLRRRTNQQQKKECMKRILISSNIIFLSVMSNEIFTSSFFSMMEKMRSIPRLTPTHGTYKRESKYQYITSCRSKWSLIISFAKEKIVWQYFRVSVKEKNCTPRISMTKMRDRVGLNKQVMHNKLWISWYENSFLLISLPPWKELNHFTDGGGRDGEKKSYSYHSQNTVENQK